MSIGLPQPIATSSQWQLTDWLDQSYQSPPAVGGVATIELPQLDYNTRWELTHMVVGCSSTTSTRLRLYLNSVANSNLRDGSDSGSFDVADWPAGLKVPASSVLVAQWTGCSDGALATLTVQGNIYRLSGT